WRDDRLPYSPRFPLDTCLRSRARTLAPASTGTCRGRPEHGGVLALVDQQYLFQARQMQALSLTVHIPLVCFGIAFPALVLFVEWRYLRTGDPLYRTIARRWSRLMLALFA